METAVSGKADAGGADDIGATDQPPHPPTAVLMREKRSDVVRGLCWCLIYCVDAVSCGGSRLLLADCGWPGDLLLCANHVGVVWRSARAKHFGVLGLPSVTLYVVLVFGVVLMRCVVLCGFHHG